MLYWQNPTLMQCILEMKEKQDMHLHTHNPNIITSKGLLGGKGVESVNMRICPDVSIVFCVDRVTI